MILVDLDLTRACRVDHIVYSQWVEPHDCRSSHTLKYLQGILYVPENMDKCTDIHILALKYQLETRLHIDEVTLRWSGRQRKLTPIADDAMTYL